MRVRCPSSLLLALLTFWATAADAQQNRRPFRTEFGPGERDELRADQLVLTGSLYGGLDDTTRLGGPVLLDDTLQSGRLHQGGNLSLSIVRRRPQLALTASAGSAVRYYHSLNRIGTQRHLANGSAEWVVNPKLTLQFGQDVTYSPSYSLLLAAAPTLANEEPEPASSLDYELSRGKQLQLGTFASAKYVLSATREVTAGYSIGYTNFLATEQRDFGVQQASARFSQALTGGLGLNLGYGAGSGTGTGLTDSVRHIIDVGLSFDRSFTVSPRTVVGFTSGSAIVNTGNGKQIEVLGSLNLRRRLSPRWTSSLGYQRGLTAIDGVAAPLTTNTFTADASGFLGMRTSVTVRPVLTWGASVADGSQSFHTSASVARVQTALGRHLAAFAEYSYYDHRFSRMTGLRPSLAADTRRHGVRTGVSLWSPLR
jgi:hypothetical protein